MIKICCILVLLLVPSGHGLQASTPSQHPFLLPSLSTSLLRAEAVGESNAGAHLSHDGNQEQSRRNFFRKSSSALMVPLATSIFGGAWRGSSPQLAFADENAGAKVLVLGGTGFVGSRVVQNLRDQGVTVIATSRDGRDGTVAFDVTQGIDVVKETEKLSKGCIAVISCIGAIGSPTDAVVNAATGLAAQGAKAAGVERFVYISVAPEVKEFAKGIEFLEDYMTGKTFSQTEVLSNFPSGATLIEPTFIYGGDTFQLQPPRVASFYGEFIETLLSSGPIRGVANIAPEGIVKIALEPPVSVNAVAAAAVAGALEKSLGELDTYDKIKTASL